MLAAALTSFLGPEVGGRLRSLVHWAFVPAGDLSGTMYLATSIERQTVPVERLSADQSRRLQAENAELHRRINTLEDEVCTARRVFRNGKRVFSQLFGPSDDTPVRLISARVVAGDSLPYGWTRLVNVGQKLGSRKGMWVTNRRLVTNRSKRLPENLAVLSGTALAGRICETGAFTARLQLVTDKGFAIRAQVKRIINPRNPRRVQIGARMVRLRQYRNPPVEVFTRGDGTQWLIAGEVNKVHNIQPGDILQTRPEIGSLPVAVDIGKVVKVSDDSKHPGRSTLWIKPAVNLPALREVFIVIPGMAKLGGVR